MSFDIVKTINFPQTAFQFVPQEILEENAFEDLPILGGILSDLKHIWHTKGPCLEVRNIGSGRKVGSWTFGGILKDSNTKIIAVDELKRPHGRLPLLVIALECSISGGLVCVFDIFGSKVLRVIQIRDQITTIHVVDSGCENSLLPEPSPLRYFDGIIAIGCLGGSVYLLDICRQICENAIQNADSTIRDELNPCPMVILKKEKTANIKKYVERSVEKEEHLAIHINVVINPSTEHFTLQGEKGEDRVHVNRPEAEVSSLFYSPQIASILVGYNFGAFQLWDLRSLELTYTSPICEGHIPVMHFTVQEPADDPKAYCYIWVSYSHNLMYHSGLPFAVMYSFYYENKNYINGYGNLYEDFQHCSVRFQLELGNTDPSSDSFFVKGGTCIGLQSLNKYPINKDLNSLSLCLVSWLIWDRNKDVKTCLLLFDLNQWYKEQMPREPNWSHCSNYIISQNLDNHMLDLKLDQKSLSQFIGIQRLEEHFCPTSLSFDLLCINEDSILKAHNKGLQQAFIDKIVVDQQLVLLKPEDYFEDIVSLGLVPLFCEIHLSNSMDIDYQREMILNVALEQKLVSWLCSCSSKLANNAFHSNGLTIYTILNWAFERAITLKNSCDEYCISLFDYSGARLDNNTIALINSSTNQIRNLCSLYRYISNKLMLFISDKDALLEEQRSLENVVAYFEVLLWMVNIGLLPEYQLKNYLENNDSFVSAPYLVHDLTQYYNRKRAQLQMASHDTFVEKDCLLFIDNLINLRGGAEILRQQWQEDGGSGLYPPPSLQSVLRTYFLDGPDIVFKHSLVTYTLLDIAMTVDENNKVIKLLLKFPQIFDLSQSHIKIVQAFWHLDHDDYETALEYILDPCVLTEDLHHWHHSVMMRSLLLQEQSNLALLYLQVRKPSIQDEKGLLTVISLLVSKNMLDEAFKFRQQHQSPNEQALLMHIFNECNKNELLHTLLYRRLNNGEEKTFFKYLQNTKNPGCEDLKVFYYLLRSRFLEAFDCYSLTKRKKPDTQGLRGQRDATTADNIVKMFKTLLPDVNKNLVDLVRKERTNLWKELRKPTPLSVFVHNASDQVQYKSSVIFAALAKAKQTFNDTLNDTRMNNDVVTEETPFLRTPTVFKEVCSMGTPLMKSKVIEQNEQGEEYSPSPCKKLKLSPRTSKTSPVKSKNLSSNTIQSKLSTPIIKRKRLSMEPCNITGTLPQSILKGSSVTRTILDDSIFDENTSVNTSVQLECENSIRRSRLALSPRRAVSRYSGSSTEQNSRNESISHSLTRETSRRESVNSTASTIEDLFYSPEHSFEEISDKDQKASPERIEENVYKKSLSPVREKLNFDEIMTTDEAIKEDLQKNERESSKTPVEDNDLSTNRLTFQSPRSRRSYKRSFTGSPIPVRSSPRLAKKASEDESIDSTSSEPIVNKSESLVKPSPSVAVQKIRGRKSLSRAVLEHNAYSKLRPNTFEEIKKAENKSDHSSANTSYTGTESDIDMEQSHNDSLEAFLKKYRTNTSENSPFNKNFSNSFKEDEIVSKTKEVQNVEVRKEVVRKSNTGELVSSKETREEYHSKKVEIFDDENKVEKNISKGILHDSNVNINNDSEDVVEDDKRSEAEVSDKQESLNQDRSDEAQNNNSEELNIYEDLSSGSEDVKEVLQQFKKRNEDVEQVYDDILFSTSASYYQSESKKLQMPDNFMESTGSNSNDDKPISAQIEHVYDNDIDMEELYVDDIPDAERAFVSSGDVIEIGSSSDEDNQQKEQSQDSETGSESRSGSSSEDKSYSSNDSVRGSNVSNESYDLNVGFENNLNEETEKTDASRLADENLIGEGKNDTDDVFLEEPTRLSQERIVEKDKMTLNSSDEGPDIIHQKTKPTQNEISSQPRDMSPNHNVSDPTETEIKLDQQEITEAVENLLSALPEEDPDAEEHMDSLILEQSPEKTDKDHPEPQIVKFDHESKQETVINKDDHIINEGDKLKDVEFKSRQLIVKTVQDTPQHDADKTKYLEEKGTPTSPVMESRSLQCTLGVNDYSLECSVDDYTLEKGKNIEPNKNQSPVMESRSLQCTLGVKDYPLECSVDVYTPGKGKNIESNKNQSKSPVMESRSLQCTLGVNDYLMECSVDNYTVGKSENIESNKNQIPKNLDKTKQFLDKATSTSIVEHSRSLQSISEEDDSVMEYSMDPDTSVFQVADSSQTKEGTPLMLRSVKKTYKGRRPDLDATPKLAASLTKKTYSRKYSELENKLSETETQQSNVNRMEQSSEKNKQNESVIEKIEANKDSDAKLIISADLEDPSKNSEKLKNTQDFVIKDTTPEKSPTEPTVGKTSDLDATPKLSANLTKKTYSRKYSGLENQLSQTKTHQQNVNLLEPSSEKYKKKESVIAKVQAKKDSDEKHITTADLEDSSKNSENLENKTQESPITETTREKSPKEQTVGKTSNSSENNENMIGKDSTHSKEEQGGKPTPSLRVTRRRSILLSQEEETPSSVSEESVSSSSVNLKMLKGTKDGSNDISEQSTSGSSNPNTSQTPLSQAPTSKRTTRLSKLSETLFDKTFFAVSLVVPTEIDIMETLGIKDKSKVRIERDILETDADIEDIHSSEGKLGPTKIRSRRSSKHSTENEPFQKHTSHAILPANPKKRTRSASVDQPSAQIRKRSIRSKSIDLDNIKGPDTNEDLRVVLIPLEEQPGTSTQKDIPQEEGEKLSSKAYSDVGAYTTSRRLTRRQASMLKTIGRVEKETKKLPGILEIDPLDLLDKSEFTGKPDLDESNVFEASSPSNSSGTPSRRTRSASVLSDVLSTPPTRKSKTKDEHLSTPVTGIKSRLRRQSTDTLSVASEQSDSPSPSKKSKKKATETDTDIDNQTIKSAKRGRSRTDSVSSTQSAASDRTDTSTRTTRSRRIQSAKSELPEIQEEKGSDEGESIDHSMIKKRGRKKKE